MDAFSIVSICIFALNLLLVLSMIFIERRKPQSIITWLVVLTTLPLLGWFIYVLVGGGLSYKTKKLLKRKRIYDEKGDIYVLNQGEKFKELKENSQSFLEEKYNELILFNINNSHSAYIENNDVKVYTDGESVFEDILKDLQNAKESINLLYYIFANDEIGNKVADILKAKAREGVKVKLIYDSVGCLKTKRKFFRQLSKAGVEVAEFFPPFLGIRVINLKMNYRNHRKILVIDGKIGYTGGINIRDDHLGKNPKISPWRDTHIRVVGNGVIALQNAFFNDWFPVKKIDPALSPKELEMYFPLKKSNKGSVGIQVITNGPETPEAKIRDALIKLICLAKNTIYIQTPYFIPDDGFMDALKIAIKSGVNVKIMIPKVADKKFVYYATLSYAKEICDEGAEIYMYHGFIHSKTIVVDGDVVSIGTTNIDNRSFALNFEVNTVLYSPEFAQQNEEIFFQDALNSDLVGKDYFKNISAGRKMMQAIFRIFSPLL